MWSGRGTRSRISARRCRSWPADPRSTASGSHCWGSAWAAHTPSPPRHSTSAAGDFRRLLQRSRDEDSWTEFLARVDSDRTSRARGGDGETVDAWEIIQPDEESRTFLDALYAEFPQLACRLSLETADLLLGYVPELSAPEIAPRPVLLIHGENDQLVPPSESESLVAAIGESARLVSVPEMAHFDWARPGDDRYEKVLETIEEWLKELGR